nr:16S rRNA (cytosine(967)-C(5))-methyltransferase RsmB [Gammaproteobacteria bacterium]
AAAARCLARVIHEGASLAEALPAAQSALPAGERPFVQALAYGTLRWYPRLAFLADGLLQRPFRRRDAELQALVLAGLYQLLEMRVPAHAAVAETVDAARVLGKGWAAGVINGVLRELQRSREPWLARVETDEEARLAHPAWLLERYRRDWPADWEAIAHAGNAHPPLTVRVNALRADRDAYIEEARAAGLGPTAVPGVQTAVTLARAVDVAELPGFAAGRVSVQDAAAQLAAPLLGLAPGQRVLDACAAPGGKTAHLLEHEPGLAEVVAVERDGERLARVGENLARLGLRAELVEGDASRPSAWWGGRGFDRILLDAPCSGTGVIRRHPDIKLLRTTGDIDALAQRQQRLLEALWPLLAPGGMLLYATCSVLARENAEVVGTFLRSTVDAREQALPPSPGRAAAHGRQILPGEGGMDGFYYAGLGKPDTRT